MRDTSAARGRSAAEKLRADHSKVRAVSPGGWQAA
jgi:hypothetical protein